MTVSPERIEEALAAANFWLRTLEPCDCPEEVYPTGDRLTIHEPFCSTVMLSVAAALREAQAENERLRERCPTCGHEWQQHDPEDGACDAHSDEPEVFGPCRCGRDVSFTAKRNAELSRAALAPADEAKHTQECVAEVGAAAARADDPGRTRGSCRGMTRLVSLLLLVAVGLAGAVATVGATDPPATTVTVTRTEKVRVLTSFQGRKAVWWAKRTWYWKRRSIALKRTLAHTPQVSEAINLACITYSLSCGLMWSLARCESHLYAGAKNSSSTASGLFQMLYPSTWNSTPYSPFSVWSPYANSMAAAHMLANGRRGEWVC